MGPTVAVRIENSVAVDHFVILVFEEGKIKIALEAFAQHLAEFFRIVVAVDADREDLHFLFLLFGQ